MTAAARLHIFGASGSGTTTLGRALAASLGILSLDADDYYWHQQEPYFTHKRPVAERLQRLRHDMREDKGWVLSGSVVGWGDSLIPRFTVAIFTTLPTEVRLARLREREHERFGSRIEPGGDRYEASLTFLAWAARYDRAGLELRSHQLHETWSRRLSCPLVRLQTLKPVEELVTEVLDQLAVVKDGEFSGRLSQ